MENYLIIDDVDLCFIQQNSWTALLEKQILRNDYLFKLYECNRLQSKNNKYNWKELSLKIKDSLAKNISLKIKKRKYEQRNTTKNQLPSASITLRRKTQESAKKSIQIQISRNNSNHQIIPKTCCIRQPYAFGQQRYAGLEQKGHFNFLPFESSTVIIKQEGNPQKKKSKKSQKSIQRYTKSPKLLNQGKPILSLHDLQLNRQQYLPIEQLNFHKKVNNIEKLLIQSSLNSPSKHGNASFDQTDKLTQKKSPIQFPEIQKSSAKKLSSSQFISQLYKIKSQTKNKSCISHKNSEDTKQSDSQTGLQLESIMQCCIKAGCRYKQEGFEDHHFMKQNELRNYRISKIKNIKFPLY